MILKFSFYYLDNEEKYIIYLEYLNHINAHYNILNFFPCTGQFSLENQLIYINKRLKYIYLIFYVLFLFSLIFYNLEVLF